MQQIKAPANYQISICLESFARKQIAQASMTVDIQCHLYNDKGANIQHTNYRQRHLVIGTKTQLRNRIKDEFWSSFVRNFQHKYSTTFTLSKDFSDLLLIRQNLDLFKLLT